MRKREIAAELAEARARIADLSEALEESRRETRDARTVARHLGEEMHLTHRHCDRRAASLTARLARAVGACARYRRELAAQGRLVRAQQDRLDGLLGLDAPEVEAGSGWQERRTDIIRRPTSPERIAELRRATPYFVRPGSAEAL